MEDLQKLLEHCANIANDLLGLLNGLQSYKTLMKAIKIVEMQGKLLQIRNELNQKFYRDASDLGRRPNVLE